MIRFRPPLTTRLAALSRQPWMIRLRSLSTKRASSRGTAAEAKGSGDGGRGELGRLGAGAPRSGSRRSDRGGGYIVASTRKFEETEVRRREEEAEEDGMNYFARAVLGVVEDVAVYVGDLLVVSEHSSCILLDMTERKNCARCCVRRPEDDTGGRFYSSFDWAGSACNLSQWVHRLWPGRYSGCCYVFSGA